MAICVVWDISVHAAGPHLASWHRWKASQQAGAEGALSDLTLKDKHGEVIEKQLPGGKVKKKAKNEIILETNTRSRKKCVTTILGVGSAAYYFTSHKCVPLTRRLTAPSLDILLMTCAILLEILGLKLLLLLMTWAVLQGLKPLA